jgi:hypothetical protein
MSEIQAQIDAKNQETSKQEVANFLTREAGPYTAYVSSDGKRITTWMGETLATITSTGTPFKTGGWLSSTLTPFRAKGIDGRMYFGRFHGPGVYVKMRPAKAV